MKKYRCTVCDWIYDPAVGDPDNGVAPGTAFEDIPDDWVCPVCGVGKEDFEVEPDFKKNIIAIAEGASRLREAPSYLNPAQT